MNKKIIKILKFILIIFIATHIILIPIISQNNYHLDMCTTHDCSICAIINLTQIIIKLFSDIHIYIAISFLTYFVLLKIYKFFTTFISNSLFLQKVQLNE
jgi:hypothetical protein